MNARAALLALLAVAGPALAGNADDEAALRLADITPAATERHGDWRAFLEAARGETLTSGIEEPARVDRVSLGAAYDRTFAPGWRAVFADRLDARWPDRRTGQENVNTLKEAYVSWQPGPDRIVDAGRINTRYGVGFAYNPTDYFRAGAVRSVVSIDPSSVRENRLGSVMARGQGLWTGGSLTALYSPKLVERPTDDAFSPDLGATNHGDRWQLVASQAITDTLSPQWIVHGGAGQSPQLGVNVTTLVNDATIAYFEGSFGRSPSLASQALASPGDSRLRSRFATGFTYTTAAKLSVTLEYEFNGAGADAAGWDALRRGSPAGYGRYRAFVTDQQELPTRGRVYLRASWQDAFVDHLDLTSDNLYDPVDSSRQHGLEVRYHWTRVDAALQWQVRGGAQGSEFGAPAGQHSWQALVTWFY